MKHLSQLLSEDIIVKNLLARSKGDPLTMLKPLDRGRYGRGKGCAPQLLDAKVSSRRRGKTSQHKIQYETVEYKVRCPNPYGSGRNHRVFLAFMDVHKKVPNRRVFVKCYCEDFVYGGVQWWAYNQKYLKGGFRKGSKVSPPNIRDPKGKNRACKHIIACLLNEELQGKKTKKRRES